MIADRSFQPANAPSTRSHWHTQDEIDHDSMELVESLLFVINEDGATKIVKKRHWGKFIRCVSKHKVDADSSISESLHSCIRQ